MSIVTTVLFGKTFCVHTFGCQMNMHDSERIVGVLESYGARQVSTVEESEIVIFMTCSVREAAEVRLYGQVASLKNIPLPKGSTLSKRIVAVGGCIGQLDNDSIPEKQNHVDVVFGTQNISRMAPMLIEAIEHGGHHVEVVETSTEFSSELPTHREIPWAAWLPINVGCDNFCTYCIVPYARGRERSRKLEDIVAEAAGLVADGVKEITLLGQNVNSYGRDLYGEPRFADVLRCVSETGIERIRFATSHPKDITDEVIGLFGELDNLMPAIHLPAQSGSNRILKAMNRYYTAEHYMELIQKLRAARPDIALSTDIIVGFPGETEEDFMATYNLVKEVGYSQVFTFIYSKRSGTPAAEMIDDTPSEVIHERFDRLVELVQSQAYDVNQRFTGQMMDVLVEGTSKRGDDVLAGRNPHNLTVHAPIPEGVSIDNLRGTIIPIRIDDSKTWYLSGTVVNAQ